MAHRIGRDRALCSCWESSVRRRIKASAPEPVRSEKSLALVTPLCEECLDLNTERWRGAHGDASDAQLRPQRTFWWRQLKRKRKPQQ